MNRHGKLDEIDFKIINSLRRNPRLQNRALAAEVGTSEPTIYARLRELNANRVCEIRAQLDFTALGYTRIALVDVFVQGRAIQDVASELAQINEAHSVVQFIEEPRLVVLLLSRSDQDLLRLTSDEMGKINGIARVAIHSGLNIADFDAHYGEIGADRHEPLPIADSIFDQTDQALVELLRMNARLSNRQIAAEIGSSETNVRRRLARLQDDGTLKFALVCAPAMLGLKIWGYVRLAVRPSKIHGIVEELVAMPETSSLIQATGEWNIHFFNLFKTDAAFEAMIDRISLLADHQMEFEARKVMRVIKANYDYTRILETLP